MVTMVEIGHHYSTTAFVQNSGEHDGVNKGGTDSDSGSRGSARSEPDSSLV